jgi:hypothetical protein
MSNITDRIVEIDTSIGIARSNLAQIIEQATAYSGAHDEELAAQRIADLEAEIKRLIQLRAEIGDETATKS